jgi:hypothetical protein
MVSRQQTAHMHACKAALHIAERHDMWHIALHVYVYSPGPSNQLDRAQSTLSIASTLT